MDQHLQHPPLNSQVALAIPRPRAPTAVPCKMGLNTKSLQKATMHVIPMYIDMCVCVHICIHIYGTPPKDLPNSMLLQTLLATFASKIVQRSVGRILDPD